MSLYYLLDERCCEIYTRDYYSVVIAFRWSRLSVFSDTALHAINNDARLTIGECSGARAHALLLLCETIV